MTVPGRLPHPRAEELGAEPQGDPGDAPREQLQHAAHLPHPQLRAGRARRHRVWRGQPGPGVQPGVRAAHPLRLCAHLLAVPVRGRLLRPHHQHGGRGQVSHPDHTRLLHLRRRPLPPTQYHRSV